MLQTTAAIAIFCVWIVLVMVGSYIAGYLLVRVFGFFRFPFDNKRRDQFTDSVYRDREISFLHILIGLPLMALFLSLAGRLPF